MKSIKPKGIKSASFLVGISIAMSIVSIVMLSGNLWLKISIWLWGIILCTNVVILSNSIRDYYKRLARQRKRKEYKDVYNKTNKL